MSNPVLVRSLIVLTALVVGAAPVAWGGSEPKGDIAWVRDLATAQATAAREGKPLIAYFTFDT